jgi:hypothetical protein
MGDIIFPNPQIKLDKHNVGYLPMKGDTPSDLLSGELNLSRHSCRMSGLASSRAE